MIYKLKSLHLFWIYLQSFILRKCSAESYPKFIWFIFSPTCFWWDEDESWCFKRLFRNTSKRDLAHNYYHSSHRGFSLAQNKYILLYLMLLLSTMLMIFYPSNSPFLPCGKNKIKLLPEVNLVPWEKHVGIMMV